MGVYVRTRQLKVDVIVRRLIKRRCLRAWKAVTQTHKALYRLECVLRFSVLEAAFSNWHTSTVKVTNNMGVSGARFSLRFTYVGRVCHCLCQKRLIALQREAAAKQARDAAATEARNEARATRHYFQSTCGAILRAWKNSVEELRLEKQRLVWENEKLKQVMAWLPPL
jgi:hypothetical protein